MRQPFSLLLTPLISILTTIGINANPFSVEAKTLNTLAGVSESENNITTTPGIQVRYSDNIPLEFKNAFNSACSFWESKLNFSNSIYLFVDYDSFDEYHPLEVEVSQLEEGPFRGCPITLARQKEEIDTKTMDGPDAYIVFNNNLDWNTKLKYTDLTEYDAFTESLRAIAISLGFGSSLTIVDELDEYGVDYLFEFPNYFDRIIKNNDEKFLTECENRSYEMYEFITNQYPHIETVDNLYPLYAPMIFEPWNSLIYLDFYNCLMSHSIGQGYYFRDIDEYTIDILKEIGWNFKENNPLIYNTDPNEQDEISAYSSHNYTTEINNADSYNWKLLLKNKYGLYKLISESNTSQFKIEPIHDTDDIKINKNGIIEGRIECSMSIMGNDIELDPIEITIDAKPKLVSIDNFKKIYDTSDSFHAEFDLLCLGASDIYVEVEEEYTGLRLTKSYKPATSIHVVTSNISSLNYVYIYVILRNEYGNIEEMIVIPPTQ